MNGTPEVGPMSTAEAIDFRNITNAESVTILIHGVGAGTSRALLDDATRGYRDSGFDRPVTRIPLPDCPSLLGEKDGEAILINGRTGGHFIVALPWSKRLRLGVLAKRCTSALIVVTIVTVMGYLFNRTGSGLYWLFSSWHTFLIYPIVTILAPIVNALIQGGKQRYRLSPKRCRRFREHFVFQ